MKKFTFLIVGILMFFMVSCEKEPDIVVEKTYIQKETVGGNLGYGGLYLKLMPDGKADFLFAGDIMERGTYTVKGKKITLKGANGTHVFRIMSEKILIYNGEYPVVLELR